MKLTTIKKLQDNNQSARAERDNLRFAAWRNIRFTYLRVGSPAHCRVGDATMDAHWLTERLVDEIYVTAMNMDFGRW